MSDSLFPLLLLLRYMHILGAIILMGGTIFMRFALRPAAKTLPSEVHSGLHEQVRTRWAKVVALASLLILVSGITNLALASRNIYEPVFGLNYNMVVGVKFLLALPIFFIAAILMGRSNLSQKFKASADLWLNINLVLALVMVLIGGVLRFVPRQPKNEVIRPAATVSALNQNASQNLPFSGGGE